MLNNWNIAFGLPPGQWPWWAAGGAAFIALLALALFRLERRRRGRVERFVEAGLAPRLVRGIDERMRRPLPWLAIAGFAALLAALAQPRWGEAWREVYEQSHDVVVVLDTSMSMLATDLPPNRLDRAKQKIAALAARAPGDRFALVAFAGAAEMVCPLTTDQGYFRAVLQGVNTDTLSLLGTDIASAIDAAVEVFREDDERTGAFRPDTRAILVISDGEQVSGDAVEAARAASRYARIYVIGVGDPAGVEVRLPDWMARYMRGQGAPDIHLSRLDEDTLTRVALAGNGAYIRATPDNNDIDQIHTLINQLSTRHVGSDIRLHLVNRYQWPLAVAIVCFAAEGLWLVLLPWVRRLKLRRTTAAEGGLFD